MRLYRAVVEVELLVAAEDSGDAEDIAERKAGEEISNGGASISLILVTDPMKISPEWRGALPYGGDGETTCAAMLAARTPNDGETK